MPVQSEKQLCRLNIEKAIQRTFNIKKRHIFDETVINTGLEISGAALASQDAHELQEFAHSEGFKDIVYNFVPNCRWSCINLNKIKVQWTERVQQVEQFGRLYNVVPGKWMDGTFYPDIVSRNVVVTICPDPGPGTAHPDGSGYALLPFHTYDVVEDISDLVPTLKFGRVTLECVQPRSLKSVSVNRQGIYINRKYRDKVEQTSIIPVCSCVNNYELTIHYGDNILFQEKLVL